MRAWKTDKRACSGAAPNYFYQQFQNFSTLMYHQHFDGYTAMKRFALFAAVAGALTCENPVEAPVCQPSISCSGTCSYYSIFDSDGNFIAEGFTGQNNEVQWDGLDCRGNPVPCGVYTATITTKTEGGLSQRVNTTVSANEDVCLLE